MTAKLLSLLGCSKEIFFSDPDTSGWGEYSVDDSLVDDREYVTYPELGIKLLFELSDDDVYQLDSVFLSDSDFISKNLASLLGVGVSFNLGRDSVREKFGDPHESGAFKKSILGPVPPWDKFALTPSAFLHFQYDFGASKIEMITLQKQ